MGSVHLAGGNTMLIPLKQWAEKVGMTESDISEAISEVRKIRKAAIIVITALLLF